MNERTHLDLFSGIGGFALAAKWNGYRTVGFCDNEPYAQAVLKKHWPEVPCHKDIREVRGDLYAGVTLLTGGFPCQPFSVAGKQRGKDDNRYLWPEMCRVIREARPAWIIGENVAGIVNLALDTVCADLEAEGYEVEPIIIPACAVDAPHRRDRVWIIARNVGDTQLDGYAASKGFGKLLDQPEKQRGQVEEREFAGAGGSSANVADTNRGQLSQRESEGQSVQVSGEGGERVGDVSNSQRTGLEGHGRVEGNDKEGREEQGRHVGESGDGGWQPRQWLTEPDVGRVAHGVPNRVAKLRGLGNAIVPQVAAEIIRNINIIMEQP
jgi:DNA (cytosine-5)-methyltransferase 1